MPTAGVQRYHSKALSIAPKAFSFASPHNSFPPKLIPLTSNLLHLSRIILAALVYFSAVVMNNTIDYFFCLQNSGSWAQSSFLPVSI